MNKRCEKKKNITSFLSLAWAKDKKIFIHRVAVNMIDLIFITFVITYFIFNIITGIFYLCRAAVDVNNSDFILNMVDNNNVSTERKILHGGGWDEAIKSIFIYGSGVLRLQLARSGSPGAKGFVIASTLAADAFSKIATNAINDPSYVRDHYDQWNYLWSKGKKDSIDLDFKNDKNIDTAARKIEESLKKSTDTTSDSSTGSSSGNNFLPDFDFVTDLQNKLINKFFDIIRPILEPVTVDYSNELLATQIYHLSIILFILAVLITVLIIALFINMFVAINGEIINKYFTNKYIRWYISINVKLINIEVFVLGFSIISFMTTLIEGLRFIATHPILIT